MRQFGIIVSIFCIAAAPTTVGAAVRINEIAWMGTERSYADEWIELKNTDGSAVDLAGWTLSWGDTSVQLEGSIAADDFLLLERTNDESVPDALADLVYTGGLANSGETLVLADDSGNTVDEVVGGEGWENIGGDNESKQTPQYTGSTWQTAAPTPAAENAGAASVEQSENESETTDTRTDEPSGSVEVREPEDIFGDTTIHVDAGGDRTVTVGAAAEFNGRALGFEDEPLTQDGAEYTWTFGDGTRTDGKNVTHIYRQPGRYAVVLSTAAGKFTGRDVITVTAEPAQLEIVDVTPVYVALKNAGNRDIDLSGWHLHRGGESFTFPPETKLLAGATVRFESAVTNLPVTSSNVWLAYPTGQRAVAYQPSNAPAEQPGARERSQEPRTQSAERTERSHVAAREITSRQHDEVADTASNENETDNDANAAPSSEDSIQAAAVGTTPETNGLAPWFVGLAGLLGMGATAAVAIRRSNTTPEGVPGDGTEASGTSHGRSGYTIEEIDEDYIHS